MVLTDPFWVYGTITDAGVNVEGAVVYIQDTTVASSVLNETTPANGQYTINIQTIANDGDTISVWVTTPTGLTASSSFVLDVSGVNQLIDLGVTGYPVCPFTITTTEDTWDVNMPESVIYGDSRILIRLNLWNDLFISDGGKEAENITLNGFDPNKAAINNIDAAMDDGLSMIISGFNNGNIDGTWVAESFSYTREEPGRYGYSISLERVR